MAQNRITTEEAARRVLGFYNKNVNSLFHIETVMAETGLTLAQVRRAERYAKWLLAEHQDQVPNLRLHISLSNVSEHGLVRLKNDIIALEDGLSRAAALDTRSQSELEYAVQGIERTLDDEVATALKRALTQQRAATESLASAREKLAKELAKLDSE